MSVEPTSVMVTRRATRLSASRWWLLLASPLLVVVVIYVNGLLIARWAPEQRYYQCEETSAGGCQDPEWSWLHNLLS